MARAETQRVTALRLQDQLESNRRLRRGALGLLATLVALLCFAAFGWWNFKVAEKAKADAEKAKGEAEGNLRTATLSVDNLLDLYLELPRKASKIGGNEPPRRLANGMKELEKAGVPASLRVTSPEIFHAVAQIDKCISEWQSSTDGPNDSVAGNKCGRPVLELVRITKKALESGSLHDPGRSKLERDRVTTKLCNRAKKVMLNIAKQPTS